MPPVHATAASAISETLREVPMSPVGTRSPADTEDLEVPPARPRPSRSRSSSPSDTEVADSSTVARSLNRSRFKARLVLENSGSVARDHLASERTFLAYVRTSLAIASTGVALVQLFTIAASASKDATIGATFSPTSHRIQRYARPLGATVVILGLAVLVIGVVRYFSVQAALPKGKFPVARWMTAAIAFSLGAVIAVVFGVLVGGKH